MFDRGGYAICSDSSVQRPILQISEVLSMFCMGSFHITCASFRTCQGNLEVTGHRCADPNEPKFAAWKSSLRMLARPQGLLVEQLYPAPKSWKCILWCFNYNNTLNILLTLNLRKVASHQLLHVQHRPKKCLKACLSGWKDGCHSFAPLSRPPV